MSYIKISLFGLLLCALSMPGCSSNTSSSSGSGSGSGFSINLTATQTVLPQGGSTTLIAAIKDAQGNPVNDSATDAVTFTTSLGATITKQNSGTINGGVASAVYGAPGASSSGSTTGTTGTTTTTTATTYPTIGTTGVDQVTASYRGAFAFISIFVFKP